LLRPPQGLALMYRGISPIPELCNGNVSGSFVFESFDRLKFAASCDLSATLNISSVPRLNAIHLRSINLEAGVEPGTAQFSAGAFFLLETGASTCETPLTDAACLTANAAIGIIWSSSVVLSIQLELAGTWIEPLGLHNFAIRDPRFSLGLELSFPRPSVNEIAWSLSFYWKRRPSTTWPEALIVKNSDAVVNDVDFVTLSAAIVDERSSNDDTDLEVLGIPGFACDLLITKLSLKDVLYMIYDIARSVIELTGGLKQPASPPAFITGLINAAGNFVDIEFGIDFKLSLIDR
jgi:hypothetical protein